MPYKIYNEEEGTCLQCGTTIRGRRDKQFCSLTCKNAFHNGVLMTKRQQRAKIVATLTGNYHILEALLKEGKTGAGLDELFELGFDPAYVTEHRRGKFRHDEYACFDIWYFRTDTLIFNVRRIVSVPR